MTNHANIIVIGGGTVGSMITWKLSSLGYNVVCLESHNIAHSRSAVAGDSRLFRRSYRGKYDLSPVLSEAQKQWNILNEKSGEEVFVNNGGLYVGHTSGEYIPELIECCERDNLEYETLSAAEVRQRFPQHKLGDHESGVFEKTAGCLRTERAVHAAFRLARAHGATVHSNVKVQDIHETSQQISVRHTGGTISGDRVIIAAGIGSPALLPSRLQTSLEVRREILTWFPTLDPEAYNLSNFPIFVHIDGDYSAYGAPSLDGSMFKSTLDNRAYPIEDYPDHLYTLTPDELVESEETVARFFNGVHPEVARQECLADLYTTDRQALVGRLPGLQRTHVATAFSGTGFKMASGVGELVARSIVEDNDDMLPDFWNPARFY